MKAYEFIIKVKDQASRQLDKIRQAAGLTDRGVGKATDSFKKMNTGSNALRGGLKNLAVTLATVFSISTIMSFNSAVIQTRAEMEKYEAVLANTFQSKNMGDASMGMIKEFAASTPFQVNELTGSFVKLVNRGVIPTKAEMTSLGDLASSQGKSFDQLTEAGLDAFSGEFERLKEFGVKASKSGDQVTFTFKGQTKTIKNSEGAIKDYIMGLGKMKGVSGSMAAISKTLGGRISNLHDKFDNLKNKIGQGLKPVYSWLIDKSGRLIDLISENLPFVSALAVGFGTLAIGLGAYSTGMMLAKVATGSLTKSIIAQNLALLANPYTWIAIAVIGLIAWLVKLYNTNEVIRMAFDGLGASFKAMVSGFSEWISGVWSGIQTYAQGVWQIITSLTVGLRKRIGEVWTYLVKTWNAVSGYLKTAWTWISNVVSKSWDYIINKIRMAVGAIKTVLSPLINLFSYLFKPIADGFERVMERVRGLMVSFLSQISGKFAKWLGIDIDGMISGLNKVNEGQKKIGNESLKYGKNIVDAYKDGAEKGKQALRDKGGKFSYSELLPGFVQKGLGIGSDDSKGTGSAAGSGLSSGISGITGGGQKQTTINVSVEKLVENVNITAQNIQDGLGNVREIVTEEFLRVLNSASQMQTS